MTIERALSSIRSTPDLGRGVRGLLTGALLLALVACGSKPVKVPLPIPPKPPPVLTIQLQAGVALNPDSRGRASPLVVRVYELKSAAPFDSADFLSLYEKDQSTLGPDLVAREEIVLRPGDARLITRELHADTCCVAVMGAFRDLERARWRSLVSVVPARDNAIGFVLDGVIVQGARTSR